MFYSFFASFFYGCAQKIAHVLGSHITDYYARYVHYIIESSARSMTRNVQWLMFQITVVFILREGGEGVSCQQTYMNINRENIERKLS